MNGEVSQQSKLMGLVSYLFGFVSGIILLYLEPYDKDEYVRFHARQSIGYSIAWFGVNFIISVLVAIMPHSIGGLFGVVQGLINLGFFLMWLFLMYQAYQGNKYRVPELADLVDSVAQGPAAH